MGRISREELLQRYAAGERNFSGAKLEGMLDGIDLSGADLSGNRMAKFYLERAILKGVNLRNTRLTDSCLDAADMTGADLRGVRLEETSFDGANLTGVNLSGTDHFLNSKFAHSRIQNFWL